MNSKSIIASLSVVILMGFNAAAQAQGGMALTWIAKTPDELKGAAGKIGNQRIVVVGCPSQPHPQCNAYKGDTNITEKHHILCIVPGSTPAPAAYTARFSALKFYYNWSGGKVGLSKRRKGSTITSRAIGDQFCKEDLNDSQARMIEHHDNKIGGWNLGGFIHPNSKAKKKLRKPVVTNKFWSSIKNQPANPWD